MIATLVFIGSMYYFVTDIENKYKKEHLDVMEFQIDLLKKDIETYEDISSLEIKEKVDYYQDMYKSNSIKILDSFRFVVIEGGVQEVQKTRIQESIFRNTQENGYMYNMYDNKITKMAPIILNGSLQGYIYMENKLENLYYIKLAFVLFLVLCILFVLLVVFYISKSVIYPVKKVNTAFENISKGSLYEKVKIEGGGELSRLCSNFNVISYKLSQIEHQRREFVHNVSHELKTPLSSIKLLIESLKYGTYEDVNIYKEFFMDIYGEVDRIKQIIDDLMIVVNIDENKSHINLELTYINYLIEKLISRMMLKAKEKNISIIYKEIDNIQIKVDNIKIDRAITNILDNAIKYSNENSNIYIYLYNEEKYAVIKVKDEGIGIPQEDIGRIFERFYRVDKARSRKTGGSGLGLFIAKELIDLHGGDIVVESKEKEGTTFYVKLPLDLN
ncbi:sensor histidine kinase [Alkalithermobacter paradoxus]|uniref:histidine kinase n=1 Tax=Alkalithermobacter paradoxus TaxID=29349 RepID=A0A1V4I6R8_9FIRM|nr:sensor histidine kinase YycG [[Clostridium] thermoalcaliphilum]